MQHWKPLTPSVHLHAGAAYAAGLESIRSGRAWTLFERMLRAQGAVSNWEESLPVAPVQIPYRAPQGGYLKAIHSRRLGFAGIKIGAGREKWENTVDPATGFELYVGVGQKVEKGQILCLAHLRNTEQMKDVLPDLEAAFEIQNAPQAAPVDLVLEKIT
jgi:thymidine phosphorylase